MPRFNFLLILSISALFVLLLLFYSQRADYFFIDDESLLGTILKQPKTASRPLRIAQVAPLELSVPPRDYGGTERIVSYLTEEFVRRGHEVTLFASSDSRTSAKLIAELPAFQQHPVPDHLVYYKRMMNVVREMASQFDIIHFQTDYEWPSILEIFKDNHTALLMTIHSHLYAKLGTDYKQFPLVSISNDQRTHIQNPPNFIGTVHHGLPKELYKFVAKPAANYMAFLGRISAEKMPDWAIQIAIKLKIPLKMAAQQFHDDYWEKRIKPLISEHTDLVEFVGELNDTAKNEFLGNAMALLFPIDWPEPFGMVMIEAMACGTPVVARKRGSVLEIVEEGISGFQFESLEEGVQAVQKAIKLDRAGVRRAFEQRFTVEAMADGYEAVYRRMLGFL